MSGCISDEPVRHAAAALSSKFAWLSDAAYVPPENIVYVGLSDVDPPEETVIAHRNICAFRAECVWKRGGAAVAADVLAHFACNKRIVALHVSMDIDALDPCIPPAIGTAVSNGFSLESVCEIMQAVAETGLLVSMDLMEVNPVLPFDTDGAKQTGEAAVSIIRAALEGRCKHANYGAIFGL
jgi:arginase